MITGKRDIANAIECKWLSTGFDAKNIKSFRNIYPKGKNIVLATDVTAPYIKHYDKIKVKFKNINTIFKALDIEE